MSRLGDFLLAASADRGAWNCSTLAADWCLHLGYPDFAAAWRQFTDDDECARVASDGLVALWDRGIGDGLPSLTAADPAGSLYSYGLEPGDIAVVALAHIDEAGAIWTGERWVLRAPRGLHFLDPGGLTIAKAWRPAQ